MKCLMFAAVLFAGFSVQARTVAWWHLDELEDGAIAKGGEPLFLNSIDPAKHAGLPRAAPEVNGEWQLDSEYEPVGTAAFHKSFGGPMGFARDGDFAWIGGPDRPGMHAPFTSWLTRKRIVWKPFDAVKTRN